jgi:hypothetical protein
MPFVQYFIIQLLFLRITKPTVNELLSIEYLNPGLKRERMRQSIRTLQREECRDRSLSHSSFEIQVEFTPEWRRVLMQVFPVHREEMLAVKHYLLQDTPPIVTVCDVLCNIFS